MPPAEPGDGTRTPPAEVLVMAAGRGDRLGLGEKAFVRLAGSTLLERALAACELLRAPVIVAVPTGRVEDARRLCSAGVRVIEGGESRLATFRSLLAASTAPLLVVHDVVHPFARAAMFPQVLAAAETAGVAIAATRPNDFVYRDGDALDDASASRAERVTNAWIAQSPRAFRRELLERGLALHDAAVASGASDVLHDPGSIDLAVLGGGRVRTLPSGIDNLKITTPRDLELAEALLRG